MSLGAVLLMLIATGAMVSGQSMSTIDFIIYKCTDNNNYNCVLVSFVYTITNYRNHLS